MTGEAREIQWWNMLDALPAFLCAPGSAIRLGDVFFFCFNFNEYFVLEYFGIAFYVPKKHPKNKN